VVFDERSTKVPGVAASCLVCLLGNPGIGDYPFLHAVSSFSLDFGRVSMGIALFSDRRDVTGSDNEHGRGRSDGDGCGG
jgi:hypothetical protein